MVLFNNRVDILLHEWALFEFEEDKCKGDCGKCFSALEMESRIGVSLIKTTVNVILWRNLVLFHHQFLK